MIWLIESNYSSNVLIKKTEERHEVIALSSSLPLTGIQIPGEQQSVVLLQVSPDKSPNVV